MVDIVEVVDVMTVEDVLLWSKTPVVAVVLVFDEGMV